MRPPMVFRSVVQQAVITALVFAATHGRADTTGPMSPGTVTDVPVTSGVAWTNPGDAAVSDDVTASVTATGPSDLLSASNFGFAIPFGSTITGIQVRVERKSAAGNTASTESIYLAQSGVQVGDIPAATLVAPWTTSDTVASAGGDGTLFGKMWTREEVNDPGFGVQYGLDATGTSDTFSVDSITVEVFFTPPVTSEVCGLFPEINSGYTTFKNQFAGGSTDMDMDGLPDNASLALAKEVACNPDAPDSLADATFNAFNVNLIIFDGEAEAGTLSDLRVTLAMLTALSADMEAAVKNLLAQADPPITLSGDYTQVTCSGSTCMPQAISGRALSEVFNDFDSRTVRASNEPYSATGDLDNDGTNNVTEYNNVLDNAGKLADFVIAATSPDLNGTEPIRTPGGGGNSCFIATAAYGTPMAGELDVLRAVRDGWLLPHALGTAFVDSYYRMSPPVADRVAASDGARYAVRAVLEPIIGLSRLFMRAPGAAGGLAGAVLLAGLLLVAWARSRRARA